MKFLALMFVASLAAAADAPKLEFDQTVFDFGTASEGDELAGKYTFRNTGNAVLKIEPPETSCGCAIASVKPATVKPGESGEIDFKLDLTDMRGSVRKAISVPSNDPEQPTVTLSITGEAKALFEIDPPMVSFGEVQAGEIVSKIVWVRRLDGKKLSIASAEAPKEFLKVAVEPISTNESRLLMEAKGTGKPGQFSEIVEVTLDGATKPAFHVPVTGQFFASMKVEPSFLLWKISDRNHWFGLHAEATAVHKLTISTTLTNQPLVVGNFASKMIDLRFSVAVVKTGQVYEVAVKLARHPGESIKDKLTFETNSPDYPIVTVPIRVVVMPSLLPNVPLPK